MPSLRRFHLALALFLTVMSCSHNDPPPPEKVLIRFRHHTGLPSLSGLERYGDHYFAIGDDHPYLLSLDTDGKLLHRWPLTGLPATFTLPKAEKPDLEAITLAIGPEGPRLLLFGSGSLSPQRDVLYVVDPEDPTRQEVFPLTGLYAFLRQKTGSTPDQWNIEAAAVAGNDLILLNRGLNQVIRIDISAFWNYLRRPDTLLPVRHTIIQLPALNDIPCAFSGACRQTGSEHLLFTASAEDTPNWIEDGPVAGSLIGALRVPPSGPASLLWWRPWEGPAALPPFKAESIAPGPGENPASPDYLLVTDSDGGPSEWIGLSLQPAND